MLADLIDLNDAKPQGWYSTRQLDNPGYVDDLKRRMAINYRPILQYIWPNGRFVGQEFEVGDKNGSPGRSLKISCRPDRMGVGEDFETGEAFADLIDVWAFGTIGRRARGGDFNDVCESIEGFLGAPFKPKVATKAPPKKQRDIGQPTAEYRYTDADGKLLTIVYRHDYVEDGKNKKTFRPWDVEAKRYQAPAKDRPLYNQIGIKAQQHVVFVEGEKAAEALIKLGIPTTCAMSGSKAPSEKTDWSPLTGKSVLIWPDADQPGIEFGSAAKAAIEAVGGSAVVQSPPTDKSEGWDAADAVEEGFDVFAFLNNLKPARDGRQIDISRWCATEFDGSPKPIEWLVQDAIPLGCAGILAAMGDTGKGLLTLDLALKVATDKPDGGATEECLKAFGNPVVATGAAVILAAEDDQQSLHRRLAGLDPECKRGQGRLFVVPLPNDGGPLAIVKTSSTQGPYTTPEWDMLREQLASIPDLRLIVLDPLASFIHADVNADPAAGAFVTGLLARLATETGATVLVPHHMSKTRQAITSPEEARSAIRGSTAIVDGVRFAYTVWAMEEARGKQACAALSTDWARNKVFQGAVVKSNAPADRTVRTYVRADSGLLVDQSTRLNANKRYRESAELDDLLNAMKRAAAAGYPYTKTGSAGIFERRSELPGTLQDRSRSALRDMVDRLLAEDRLAVVRYGGQASPWLDVPDGAFSRGQIDLQAGAYRP